MADVRYWSAGAITEDGPVEPNDWQIMRQAKRCRSSLQQVQEAVGMERLAVRLETRQAARIEDPACLIDLFEMFNRPGVKCMNGCWSERPSGRVTIPVRRYGLVEQ